MKLKTALTLLCLSLAAAVYAHTPLLLLDDNMDGTLTVEGKFSTGQNAAGVDFFVKTKLEGKVIFHQKFDASSMFEIKIPEEPYYLVMDAGPGHKIVKDGPPPPDGFTVNTDAAKLSPEKSDMTGLPLPLPLIILILVVVSAIVFIVPRVLKKKK